MELKNWCFGFDCVFPFPTGACFRFHHPSVCFSAVLNPHFCLRCKTPSFGRVGMFQSCVKHLEIGVLFLVCFFQLRPFPCWHSWHLFFACWDAKPSPSNSEKQSFGLGSQYSKRNVSQSRGFLLCMSGAPNILIRSSEIRRSTPGASKIILHLMG